MATKNAAAPAAAPVKEAKAEVAPNLTGPWTKGSELYTAYIKAGGKAGPLYPIWSRFYTGTPVGKDGLHTK